MELADKMYFPPMTATGDANVAICLIEQMIYQCSNIMNSEQHIVSSTYNFLSQKR